MNSFRTALVLIAWSALTTENATAADRELPKFQGRWVVSTIDCGTQWGELREKIKEAVRDAQVVVEGNQFRFEKGGQPLGNSTKFDIDSGSRPKLIDVQGVEKGQVLKGIFLLENGVLKLYFGSVERPRRIPEADAAEEDKILLVLKTVAQ